MTAKNQKRHMKYSVSRRIEGMVISSRLGYFNGGLRILGRWAFLGESWEMPIYFSAAALASPAPITS